MSHHTSTMLIHVFKVGVVCNLIHIISQHFMAKYILVLWGRMIHCNCILYCERDWQLQFSTYMLLQLWKPQSCKNKNKTTKLPLRPHSLQPIQQRITAVLQHLSCIDYKIALFTLSSKCIVYQVTLLVHVLAMYSNEVCEIYGLQ